MILARLRRAILFTTTALSVTACGGLRSAAPAGVHLVAGKESAGRVALIVASGESADAGGHLPPLYDAVYRYRPIPPGADPGVEGRALRSTIDTLVAHAKAVDVWTSGLDGLIVRHALERVAGARILPRRVLLVDTPNRGLSPSGWSEGRNEAAGVSVPPYAASGSPFLVELNGAPIADLSAVQYVVAWRDTLEPAQRSSVMGLPRRALRVAVRPSSAETNLLSLLDAPVVAAQLWAAVEQQPRRPEDADVRAPAALAKEPPAFRDLLDGRTADLPSDSAWALYGNDEEASRTRRWGSARGSDLGGITDPMSIAYAPDTGEIVITGIEDYARSPLTVDDLWGALRAFRAQSYPGVSIDPPASGWTASYAEIRYVGETGGTHLGWTMLEADRVMKGLALGQDNILRAPLSSAVSGHNSIAASPALGAGGAASTVWRLWFEPKRWHAHEPDPLSATIEARVECNWERMTPEYVPGDAVTSFTTLLSERYGAYASEQPSFDALDQSAALVAMAQWLVDAHLDILAGAAEPTPLHTPDQTPVVEVSTASTTGAFRVSLRGGVIFCGRLRHVPDPGAPSRALTTAALGSRPGQSPAWTFERRGRAMRAVAIAAAARGPAPGIANAVDRPDDPAHGSETCIERSFPILGPLITEVQLDDAADPPEVLLTGYGFSAAEAGAVLFNGSTLTTRTWAPQRILAMLPSTPAAGQLVVRVAQRDSNPVIFTLVPSVDSRLPPTIDILNQADFPLGVDIRPAAGRGSTREIDLPAHGTRSTRVLPGKYRVTATAAGTAMVAAASTREDSYERGHKYTLTYDTAAFPLGDLVIRNDTGASVTIKVDGPATRTVTVAPGGPTTIRLSPGKYVLTASSRCGTRSDQHDLSGGMTWQVSYMCTTVRY